ncbi:MAG: family transposase [Actinomycetota bacterium]|nr:family transposase [Actinomycetota bacterium]
MIEVLDIVPYETHPSRKEAVADLMDALPGAPVSAGFISQCRQFLDDRLVTDAFEDALKDALTTNNDSDRAIRGFKLAVKVKECWRSLAPLQRHRRIRSYLISTRNHRLASLDEHTLAA